MSGRHRIATPAASTKTYTLDTHRAIDPGETLERIRPHLATMGITRIANLTGLDRIGIPVVMAVRPNSRSVAVSQGKGLSLDAAKASGAMEAAESWHAERVALPVRYASWRDLRDEADVIDIARLPRIRNSRFTPARRLLWVEGHDLGRGRPAWLPFEMVHTDYTHPAEPGHGCFPCSTNGLASGNHILEATCHAICEVIERDAISLWHHLGAEDRQATRVRPETVDHPPCREAMDRLEAAGIDVGIWETTTDIGVPAFHCLIAERAGPDGHIGMGGGCHPHRGIALLRALTEAVQTRMTYISGARDDIEPAEFTAAALGQKTGMVTGLLDSGPPSRDFTTAPQHVAETFEDDLDWLLARLRAAGCDQVVTADLSRPEIGISVVRAVIPGLEAPHDDDTYVPGPRALRAGGAGP